MINPHGGKLINRLVSDPLEKKEIEKESENLKKLIINDYQFSDLKMIATGGFSPLEGFMNREDYLSVLKDMRLKSGIIFSIPITLAVSNEIASSFKEGEKIALYYSEELVGILELEEKYEYDKRMEAKLVYMTEDESHPGVLRLYKQGEILLSGKVRVIRLPLDRNFYSYDLPPSKTREIFKELGWQSIVGFQTRNPIHRAHEYIIKCALEISDGVLIHPIVGETKKDDIPADIRMRCYEVLIEKYFPKNRVLLVINPANMRYAGPREAIFHAIIRKNYGCTHFIVGRDHAGVGNYYPPFAAQEIFNHFKKDELEITPLFFTNTFYCKKCGSMASEKTCPHPEEDHFSLSGTKVRELLKSGEVPPQEFTRPEIANILIEWWRRNS